MNFDEFLISFSKIENIPLPAEASQYKMVPPFRRELLRKHKEEMKNARKAGVLALFYPNKLRETTLVLILRKTYKGVHSAQIGFPGGKHEDSDETLKATALRETQEEIGITQNQIEVIKQMTEVYIPPSNFYVQPYIGITTKTPMFIKQVEEVEDIIEVSLNHFLDDAAIVTKSVETSYTTKIDVPAYELNGHIVWGATAMMLSEIKDILKVAI
jgi:8-oxo-dGTP pyrophosphatase MutT (NUDIX family)